MPHGLHPFLIINDFATIQASRPEDFPIAILMQNKITLYKSILWIQHFSAVTTSKAGGVETMAI
jgi:hypothetical protein